MLSLNFIFKALIEINFLKNYSLLWKRLFSEIISGVFLDQNLEKGQNMEN